MIRGTLCRGAHSAGVIADSHDQVLASLSLLGAPAARPRIRGGFTPTPPPAERGYALSAQPPPGCGAWGGARSFSDGCYVGARWPGSLPGNGAWGGARSFSDGCYVGARWPGSLPGNGAWGGARSFSDGCYVGARWPGSLPGNGAWGGAPQIRRVGGWAPQPHCSTMRGAAYGSDTEPPPYPRGQVGGQNRTCRHAAETRRWRSRIPMDPLLLSSTLTFFGEH